jgi:mannan endo-1,4-beta-mannosidase
MNGNWYAWGVTVGNNFPNDFVNMWRHFKDIFTTKGIDSNHLQLMWCVNNTDVGNFRSESYYLGAIKNLGKVKQRGLKPVLG